ncbi:MAG: hypothetical protein ABWZ40_03485, partial [Caulobacterales bacterium]
MFSTPLFLYIVIFAAVLVSGQLVLERSWNNASRMKRVNRRLTLLESGATQRQTYAALVRQSNIGNLTDDRLKALHKYVDRMLRQADLQITPARLGLITLGIAGAVWVLGVLAAISSGGAFIINVLSALVGACVLALVGVAV